MNKEMYAGIASQMYKNKSTPQLYFRNLNIKAFENQIGKHIKLMTRIKNLDGQIIDLVQSLMDSSLDQKREALRARIEKILSSKWEKIDISPIKSVGFGLATKLSTLELCVQFENASEQHFSSFLTEIVELLLKNNLEVINDTSMNIIKCTDSQLLVSFHQLLTILEA